MAQSIQLAEVLANISAELHLANSRAQESGNATMQFKECEVEFAVDFEKSAGGGFKVWVLQLGGRVKKTDSNTVRLKFTSIGSNPMQAYHAQADSEGPDLTRESPKKAKGRSRR